MGTTYRELRRVCAPWSERCLDVGRGKRIGNSDRSERKRWDPLTTGRARGLLREILSLGRAKLVELQGAVERLEDLMRRYTQRRDARNGQRHTLAEDIRMAALEALLTGELERHCQLPRSRYKDTEVVLFLPAAAAICLLDFNLSVRAIHTAWTSPKSLLAPWPLSTTS